MQVEDCWMNWTTYPSLNDWFDWSKQCLIQYRCVVDKPNFVCNIFKGCCFPCDIPGKTFFLILFFIVFLKIIFLILVVSSWFGVGGHFQVWCVVDDNKFWWNSTLKIFRRRQRWTSGKHPHQTWLTKGRDKNILGWRRAHNCCILLKPSKSDVTNHDLWNQVQDFGENEGETKLDEIK